METNAGDDGARARSVARNRQLIAALIANKLMVAYGLVVGWPAAAIPDLQGLSGPSPLASGPISSTAAAWMVSAFLLAAALVGPFLGPVAERLGAVRTGQLTAMLYAGTSATIALAQGPELLLVARVAAGCAGSAGFVFTPLYTREISDERLRGPLGALMTVLLNVGVVAAFCLGATCSMRTAAALGALPPLLFLALSCTRWLPEAPAWLLRRGRTQHAREALLWLRGDDDHQVAQELRAAEAAIASAEGSEGRVTFLEALRRGSKSRAARKAVFLTFVLILNQQLTGLFALLSYSVMIFIQADVPLSPYVSTIVVGLMLTAGSVACVVLVNYWKRRTLMVVSDLGMALGLVCMGAYFHLQRVGKDTSAISWLPLTALSVHMVVFNFGLGSLPLVIVTELFSPELVSAALTLNGPIAGLSSFLITRYYDDATKWLGVDICMWFFAGSCIVGMVLIIAFLPETKDVPLEDTLQRLDGVKPRTRKLTCDAVEGEEVNMLTIPRNNETK